MVNHLTAYVARLNALAASAERSCDMPKAHSIRLEMSRTIEQIKVLSKL